MNFTKLILLAVIYSAGLLIPALSVAAPDSDPATFEADKGRHIANILEKIQIAQKNLSCVQAAQDHTALNACDETVKQDHDVLEPEKKAPIADKKAQKNAKPKGKQ
jgi:hypothetical protein